MAPAFLISARRELEVLGRDGVRHLRRLLQRLNDHDGAEAVDGLAGYLFPDEGRHLAPYFRINPLSECARGGDENGRGQFVMLGLRQEVGS
ncbi:MAG: hypothetical protein H6R44_1117, partial [Nitrospirae bacterium]|nr:hypothetical protein [Nitrospirota bacterium]